MSCFYSAYKFTVLYLGVLCSVCYHGINGENNFKDYRNHPCLRECGTGGPMVCEYTFTLEHYYTLSKACYDCPYNKTDCSRPHCVPADGTPRGILTVNRMLPGPSIQVCLNDTVVVNVRNKLLGDEGTSIHWHGIHVPPYMDGTAMISQCPITAHSSFQYRFQAIPAGTHYWHSHSALQNSDGLFGAFIIREPKDLDPHIDLYDVDDPEYSIMLNDWRLDMISERFANIYQNDNSLGFSKSMLINGKGAYHTFERINSTYTTPYEILRVEQGKRYRFRIISNALNNCPILVSVDNHNLTVIASDGAPLDSTEVSSLVIYSGERYDIIVNANQNVSNYWMRTSGTGSCAAKKAFQLAIINYFGADLEDEPSGLKSWDWDIPGLRLDENNKKESDGFIDVSSLRTNISDDLALRPIPDRKLYLGLEFNKIENTRYFSDDFYSFQTLEPAYKIFTQQINHISSILPPAPAQTQFNDIPKDILCNEETMTRNCSKEYCECFHLIKIALGEVVEIIIVDEGQTYNSNHPFHLHGNYFRVVEIDKVGHSTSVEDIKTMDSQGQLKRNLHGAPIKDTVKVNDGGYTIIRFHAKNPGFWFFHCHLQVHTAVGMGLTFQVGTLKQQPKVPKNFPKCGPWKFEGFEDETKPNNCPAVNPTSYGIKVLPSFVTILYATFLYVYNNCI